MATVEELKQELNEARDYCDNIREQKHEWRALPESQKHYGDKLALALLHPLSKAGGSCPGI